MSRGTLFAAICGLAALNGLAPVFGLKSIAFAIVWVLRAFWLPTWIDSVPVAIYLACLIAGTLVLLLGGIPAALYERLWLGERKSDSSLYVWLAACGLLTALSLSPS
ncbi:MAG: hypothetical protein JNM79_18415 [Burkholderiales bacterium]|nr:hypothetical protein [Burkholderiales bacterium]